MHHTKNTVDAIAFDPSLIAVAPDSNNNKKTGEKYSLRKRHRRDIIGNSPVSQIGSLSAPLPPPQVKTPTAKAGRRGNSSRSTTSNTTAKEKPKQKAAPLSKYRRKTANARERTRMREINCAFENLRRCVPLSISGHQPSTSNEKLTKITTLRLAMKYIRTLSDFLTKNGRTSIENGALDFLIEDVDHRTVVNHNNKNNNVTYSHNNNTLSCNKNHNSAVAVAAAAAVSIHKDLLSDLLYTTNTNFSLPGFKNGKRNGASDIGNTIGINYPSKHSLLHKMNLGSCLCPPTDDNPTDLGLLLESDGESLHLSEPCLSPLGHQSIKAFACTSSAESPLELSLLLDSDTESLQFSEPCLSPLGPLDSLNPFGDLLHTGFAEHGGLDMYLT